MAGDGGNPVVMAVMSTRGKEGADRRDALVAKAATVAADALGR
ncbi:hypothetical protein GCM10023238_23060 [Streptomyces heliomycini]